jgi:hypothetical protein
MLPAFDYFQNSPVSLIGGGSRAYYLQAFQSISEFSGDRGQRGAACPAGLRLAVTQSLYGFSA